MTKLTLTELRSWATGINHGHVWDRAYKLGYRGPRFPVPTLIGPVYIDPSMVNFYHADPNARIAPVLTYYNESYNLPLPSDHGIADYSCDYDEEYV